MKRAFLLMTLFALSTCLLAQEHEHATPMKTSAQFEQLKKLVGKWEGTMEGGMKATAEFRMTGGGSAIMQVMGKDSPYEMVTMFTIEGNRVLATHYCAAHNQPRMESVSSSDANTVEFKYLDGTNIHPGDVHMEAVKMTIQDADHHTEVWTSNDKGKPEPGTFVFHRVS